MKRAPNQKSRADPLLVSRGPLARSMLLLNICLLCSLTVTGQQAQTRVVYSQFIPAVVRSDSKDPVLFVTKVAGSPDQVVLEYSPLNQPSFDLPMRDDGTHGDQIAGDGVYSLLLETTQVTKELRADDVFRPFVGYLKLVQNGFADVRYSIFAEVITDEIPRLPVTILAQDAQRTGYVVNLIDSDFATGASEDLARITRRFYELLPDDYDFVNVVCVGFLPRNRFHVIVKNNIQGIGLDQLDSTAIHGSSGKLLGITKFPISGLFDGAETGYQHELGHQWINFLRVAPVESGIPHWPISDLAGGIMGFSDPLTGQGLELRCSLVREPNGVRLNPRSGRPVFSDLDLYLMGLIPPDQVGEHFVLADLNQTLTCNGQLFTGPVLDVRINDIVRALGPRVPDSNSAPRRFKIATMIVSKDGLLNEDAMAFYSFFARRAEETREVLTHSGFLKATGKPFSISTGGRATLDALLVRLGAAPTTTSIDPNRGPAAGGTAITIRGTDFASGAEVSIGGARATNVNVIDATTINAFTSAHGSGVCDVMVINPDGQSGALVGAFTYVPIPEITSSEVRGKKLFVYGKNFDNGAELLMNNKKQKKTFNDVLTPTTVLIARKSGRTIAPGETVTLQVRNSDGSLSNEFSFTRPVQ